LLALGAIAAPAAQGRALAPLTTGFAGDDVYFAEPATRDPWLDRTVASGAGVVVLSLGWAGIAPAIRAPGFDAANPGDPGYNWTGIDAAVRAASLRGVAVTALVTSAPAWAEGAGRPSGAEPGSWRPDPVAFGRFATAAARRYSGTYPDPLAAGAVLPHVRYWQAWAEPNLQLHLAPQWTRDRGHFVPAGPVIYRGLLNAFYGAVKAVDPGNIVVTAGTAPFGDPPGEARMPPAQFVRELLCLHGPALSPAPCRDPAHFDVLAHHPYAVGSPQQHAYGRDDVSAPDLGKLTRPLAAAVRLGRALPRAHKRLWVTEFSYDSSPPDPLGVPAARHARWLEEAFYVFWAQGVDTVAWYLIRDQAPIPDYASTYQSGIYLRDGRPKLAAQAFRFPFVVEPAGRNRAIAWGRSPIAGVVSIERQRGARWISIAHVRVAAGGVFLRHLPRPGRSSLRAAVGAQTSLIWRDG